MRGLIPTEVEERLVPILDITIEFAAIGNGKFLAWWSPFSRSFDGPGVSGVLHWLCISQTTLSCNETVLSIPYVST